MVGGEGEGEREGGVKEKFEKERGAFFGMRVLHRSRMMKWAVAQFVAGAGFLPQESKER